MFYIQDGTIAEYPDLKFLVAHEFPYGEGLTDIKKPKRSATIIPSLDEYPALLQSYRGGEVSNGHEVDFNVNITNPSVKTSFKWSCV